MKYWCRAYPDIDSPTGETIETLSEDEILEEYYDYWSEKMIKKYGKEAFEANWSKVECIEDWVVINWAWESK